MNAQAVDSSNAPTNFPIRQAPLVGFSTNWRSPADIIQRSATSASAIQQLWFPHEKVKYYMSLNMAQYSRGGGNAGRTLGGSIQTTGQIRLPLPDSLRDLQTVNWTRADILREVFAAGAAVAGGALAMLVGAKATTVAQAGGSIIGAGGIAAVVEGLTRGGGILTKLNGIAPNQFITVLLNGPEYKVHDFTWTLSAKNGPEAESLRKIIQILNNCMAPGLSTSTVGITNNFSVGGLWWNFPNIFFLQFMPNEKYLFAFKPAVMTHFAVDYAGGHVPSFLRSDGATGGENPPEAISIHMQFLEIEYWKNGDFGGGAEGGVQPQGNSQFTIEQALARGSAYFQSYGIEEQYAGFTTDEGQR